MFWIYDFMMKLFDDPEIDEMNTILVEGIRKMFGDDGHTSISKYDEFRRYLSNHYLTLDLWSDKKCYFPIVSIMKFLSIISWLDSTDFPLINWQVQFFWSSVSCKRGDKYEFSLFHDFSDEFLPNHSYVSYTDVNSLNHMNTKYEKMIELLTRRPTTSLHERWYHSASELCAHLRIWRVTLSRSRSFLQRWYWNTSERIWYHGNKYWNNMFRSLRWTRSRNAQLRFGWDLRNVLIYSANDIRISENLQFREDLRTSLLQIISQRTSILFQLWMSQLLSTLTHLNY